MGRAVRQTACRAVEWTIGRAGKRSHGRLCRALHGLTVGRSDGLSVCRSDGQSVGRSEAPQAGIGNPKTSSGAKKHDLVGVGVAGGRRAVAIPSYFETPTSSADFGI